MVLANLPKGLPILDLSIPLDSTPSWNERNPKFFNILFSLYNSFLDDDATFSIFYLDDPNVLKDIMGYLSSNNFKIHQKWWVVNIGFKISKPKYPLRWFFFIGSCVVFDSTYNSQCCMFILSILASSSIIFCWFQLLRVNWKGFVILILTFTYIMI